MLSWFTESAIVPAIGGVLFGMALLGLAISFRDRIMLFAALIVFGLTLATVTIETLIVTDREAVTDVVYVLADAVAHNDVQAVLAHVSPDQDKTNDAIRAEMPDYNIRSCRILGINDFTIVSENPTTAEVQFVVWAEGSGRMGAGSVHRAIMLVMEKDEDGEWKMIDYDHWDPRNSTL